MLRDLLSLNLRLETDDIQTTLAEPEKTWTTLALDQPRGRPSVRIGHGQSTGNCSKIVVG
jgi:hypothetical protein